MHVEPDLVGAQVLRFDERGHVRRQSDGLRVHAAEQVHHGGVAGHDRLVDLLGLDPGLFLHPSQQLVHRGDRRLLESRDVLLILHGTRHTGDHVGAEWRLVVDRGGHRNRGPGAQVHERAHTRRGADVERRAEHAIGGVARLDVDQVLPHQRRGDVRGGAHGTRRPWAIPPSRGYACSPLPRWRRGCGRGGSDDPPARAPAVRSSASPRWAPAARTDPHPWSRPSASSSGAGPRRSSDR